MTRVAAWFARQRNRAYLYRGLVGTAPVAVTYGLATEHQVVVVLGAAAAWLGVGLASVNTTTKETDR